MTRRVADDAWTGRLSEYLDGEMSSREQRACEAHVSACADCTAVLDELRQVVARAERMNAPIEPGRDLWPGIASRLGSKPGDRETSRVPALLGWLRPQLAVAALIFFAGLAIVVWLLHARLDRPDQHAAVPPARAPMSGGHDREYERTIAALDRQARARLTLDPHVVEVLDENLATLDAAIATYRDALAADPADAHLRKRLEAARQRKLEVLRQAVTLASEGTE